jgi:hypothetical protein
MSKLSERKPSIKIGCNTQVYVAIQLQDSRELPTHQRRDRPGPDGEKKGREGTALYRPLGLTELRNGAKNAKGAREQARGDAHEEVR